MASDVLLWGVVIGQLAEGIARIAEIAQKMQNGEPVTKADLDAARRRTEDAMARLEAAVEARGNG